MILRIGDESALLNNYRAGFGFVVPGGARGSSGLERAPRSKHKCKSHPAHKGPKAWVRRRTRAGRSEILQNRALEVPNDQPINAPSEVISLWNDH
jgi:hypothetical protein